MLNTESGWRGGENQVALLVKGLDRREVAPLTVCQPGSRLELALREAGQPALPMAMRGQFHLGAIRAVRRRLLDDEFDLVHAHTSHAHALCALACRGTGVPLVVTRRVDFPVKSGWFSRWKYRSAVDRYVAVSEAVKGVLIRGGIAAERIAVIRDGVDFTRLPEGRSTLRDEFRLPTDAVAIGITAHLTDHKDHRTLLRAFEQVQRQAPQAWLFVVGTGELEDELKRLAASLALRQVVFTGFRADIGNVLRGLDVFTLSSHLEGLGSSIMDAMYCGLPVAATAAGGIPELIDDGVDGLLVPPRDPEALAHALLRLVRDAPVRRCLGEAAAAKARRRFGAARMAADHHELYRSVLAGCVDA